MNTSISEQKGTVSQRVSGERGSALVISLFVLALISVFVALALSRSSAEAAAVGNETAEGRTLYAAQGSLETMTRNFNKIFEVKLNPAAADLNIIRTAAVPGLGAYTFQQELDQTSNRINVVLTGGPYSGLFAVRDNWRLRSTATDNQGVQVQLTRNILNSRIPIFQFGIFYDDDLVLYRPPRFSFGGRVHSNRNFFVSPGDEGVYFNSRVTASGQIVTQAWRNWYTGDSTNTQTFIKNASGVDKQLLPTMGSVLNTSEGAADNVFAANPDLPPSRVNPNFGTQSAIFDGNLQNGAKVLRLPLKVGYPTDLVEMIKRGKIIASAAGGDLWKDSTNTLAPVLATTQDDDILMSERFANKTGIRVSLADSKAKLPGCASGTGTAAIAGPCGIRLDGASAPGNGGADPNAAALLIPERVRGYQPKSMKTTTAAVLYAYQPTRINGERIYIGSQVAGRQVWIKVELVSTNGVTQAIETRDITEDFLSLGMTEQAVEVRDSSNNVRFKITNTGYNDAAPTSSLTATAAQTASVGTDSRSVLKIQRFAIAGEQIPQTPSTPYLSHSTITGNAVYSPGINVVERFRNVNQLDVDLMCQGLASCSGEDEDGGLETPVATDAGIERQAHLKLATVGTNTDRAIVPFPIKMFDTREGEYYDERSTTYLTDLNRLTRNGVMSMIDIDIANLRRFLRGDFNGLFPIDTPFAVAKGGSLVAADVPQREGWVLYVSDRRGDADFDGELDMEDIYSLPPGNAIIAILTLISVPYVFNYKKAFRSEDQSLKTMDLMREAAQLALTRRRTMRFEIDLTSNVLMIIDENGALPDRMIKKVPIEKVADVRMDVIPTGVLKPNPPNYNNAAFAVDALGHLEGATVVTGHSVFVARFRRDGSVVNAADTPVSVNIYVWPPLTPGSLTPRSLKEVRAITLFGGSGAIRYWKYNGTIWVAT